MNIRLYLNVPYAEKDEAKALGAKWDAAIKKWYTDTDPENYVKFAKWILKDTDEAVIAQEYLYIIEGRQQCWKCRHSTRVIGLGIGQFITLYDDDGPRYSVNDVLRLAWTDCEEDIPPRLLRYIKQNYSAKTGYSKTLKSQCFANHCDHCGSLQGNWFLFNEPSSPLSSCAEGNELKERLRALKIKMIPIADNLQLNWDISFCSNDFAYYKYGQQEELILPGTPENECITYRELYEL